MFPKKDPEIIIYAAARDASSIRVLKESVTEVIKNTSNYLNIYDGTKEETEKLKQIEVTSYINKNTGDVKKNLSNNNIQTIIIGNGNKIVKQYPEAGTRITKLDKVILVTNSNNNVMIDLKGLSKSEITMYANLVGIKVEFEGSGYATSQSIKKGSKIKPNETVKIKLKARK